MNKQQWAKLPERIRKLARALHEARNWYSWDNHAAATCIMWIGRLDEAQPKSPREVEIALVNYDWMRPLAADKFDKCPKVQAKAQRTFELWQESRT